LRTNVCKQKGNLNEIAFLFIKKLPSS